jgi:1,4-alpha-glucan branching enzyme
VGHDLDFDYVKPYLPDPTVRGFTGMKYYSITGPGEKRVYDRGAALHAAGEHAGHFLGERIAQVQRLSGLLQRAPLIVSPYDAELFGHWWYEGPEWLDYLVRKVTYDQEAVQLTTPWEYLRANPTQQVARPSPSTWGEEGYYKVWLNENNEWILPHLNVAQERMTALAQKFPSATGLKLRALRQAGRELLLAQSSDWPFILRSGTSPDYARKRVKEHLLRFIALHEQLTTTRVDPAWLARVEAMDNLFSGLDYRYWAEAE